MSFKDVLGRQLIIADGGIGTQLQAAGLAAGEEPIRWNMSHPDVVRGIHSAYLEAGARLLTTNTFSAGVLMLGGEAALAEEAIVAGVQLAREAIAQAQLDQPVQPSQPSQLAQPNQAAQAAQEAQPSQEAFVALDIGPLGQMLPPMGDIAFDTAVELFAKQVEIGASAGADLILIETFYDSYELKAAVLAAKESCELPVLATVTLDERGRMLSGADSACVSALLEGLGADAIGMNCGGGPKEAALFIKAFRENSMLPLILSPNAGLPTSSGGKTFYPVDPNEFTVLMKPLVEEFLVMAGGCCGTTPAHIKALAESCKELKPRPITQKKRVVVSSYASSLDMNNPVLSIDTRIDPANNSSLASALLKGDFGFALSEARAARGDGAQVIGVQARYPGIDEEVALPAMVQKIQSVINVPLLLTCSSLASLESALRIYNGCALVDLSYLSPKQKQDSAELINKYGAVVLEENMDTGL